MRRQKILEQSNVYYDSFDEVEVLYSETKKDIWREANTIVLYDTDATVGLFPKSDIIIVYDEEAFPSIVTERIYRKNYTLRRWLGVRRTLKYHVKYVQQEFGFNCSVTFGKDFIDFVHYKEWWWLWAKKKQEELQASAVR